MIEKIKGMLPFNWPLLANPVNWVIVFLMIAIAGLALKFIMSPNNSPVTED